MGDGRGDGEEDGTVFQEVFCAAASPPKVDFCSCQTLYWEVLGTLKYILALKESSLPANI